MDVLTVLFVPVVLFMLFVAPVWLVLHYRSKRQAGASLNVDERQELEQLADQAERMLDRIETLESILDVEAPGWRERARRL
ncbi:MAG: envelope stress response membrane protein PspB [Gammaproteobacteria bacterium]|nr:MAG: envelope stress response membrane protein PspB [Gammaproteobacteria bacterium]